MMIWNQFGDLIDLDPDPHPSNFVDPNPYTINADPNPWGLYFYSRVYCALK